MNVMIAGGSGLIGTALTQSLVADNHKVWILTRNPKRLRLPANVQALAWDGRTTEMWLETFARMDAVVNLTGATIGQWPWSETRKKIILDSRVFAGQAMTIAFQKTSRRPPVYLQVSGVGYYASGGTAPVDEMSPAGSDFLARLAINAEAASQLVDSMGVRRVIVRSGLALARQGGVLPLLALPSMFFVGGPMGNGRQGMSWIHLQDHVRAMRFLLENDRARGPFNLCAPNPVSNADFVRRLCSVLGRPYWLPAPAWALRLALGEMSSLLLDGQYAIPQKLVNLGFSFQFQSITDAFRDLY